MSFENHPNAKKVYEYYQQRYSLGSLGLWHALGLASIFNGNDRIRPILSSFIIANGGSFKSQIMKSFKDSNSTRYWEVPFQPTDRGIVRENIGRGGETKSKHNNKIWLFDDAAVSFPSLETARQSRLLGLLTTGLMDQKYSYSDFSDTREMNVRFGAYINIAYQNFELIKKILEEKTILERAVPFNYILHSVDVDRANKEFMSGFEYGKIPKFKFEKTIIKNTHEYFDKIKYVEQTIQEYCNLSQNRSFMWSWIMIEAVAILEGRKQVIKEDFLLFNKYILPYLSLNIRVEPIQRSMIRMLNINPEAKLDEFENFLNSDICNKEFPNDKFIYQLIKKEERAKLFESAIAYVQKEKFIQERAGVVIQ